MARIQHIHHKLEIWSLWKTSGGAIGGSSSLAMWQEAQVDCDGYRGQLLSTVDEAECEKIDRAIRGLPNPLGLTVAMYYLEDSGRTRKKLGLSESVLSQRLGAADKLLEVALRKPASVDVSAMPAWCQR